MPQIQEKRTYDERLFDVDCSDLLDPEEIVLSCSTPLCEGEPAVDPDAPVVQVPISFGSVVVNAAPIYYPLLKRWAAPGKALQVRISDGVVAAGSGSTLCTLRFPMQTNLNPQLEATVLLRITDQAY